MRSMAEEQSQTFVTGYSLQSFLCKGNKKVFPLLPRLCGAEGIFFSFNCEEDSGESGGTKRGGGM